MKRELRNDFELLSKTCSKCLKVFTCDAPGGLNKFFSIRGGKILKSQCRDCKSVYDREKYNGTAAPPKETRESLIATLRNFSDKNFKAIKGFDGYLVSSCGEVVSLNSNKILTLATWDWFGYKNVNVCKDGKAYQRKVHLLVAEAFLGDKPKGLVCCHLDGNRKNNHYSNLMYATQKENVGHMLEHNTKRTGYSHHWAKLTEQQRKEIGESLNRMGPDKSNILSLAKKYSVSSETIRKIMKQSSLKEQL